MNADLLITLALLLIAIALFVSGKPRMDAVALLVLLGLPLTGVLSIEQTLSGFSDPNVVLIAALFVIGSALVRTGIAYHLGDWLVKHAGNSEARLLILLMACTATLGSIMSSTGVVAIFIPVALSIATRLRIAPSRLMMPLAFAGLISGMLTLVGTAPNLVVQTELQRAGLQGFGFFSMTPIGLSVLVLAIVYMLLTRRWLSSSNSGNESEHPRLSLSDLASSYKLEQRAQRLRVQSHSLLCNQLLNELELRTHYGINVIAVERPQKLRTLLLMAAGNTVLNAGDILLVDLVSPATGLLDTYQRLGLEPVTVPDSYYSVHARELGLAEVALPPESQLLGKSIQAVGFRSQHKLTVVGIRRQGQALEGVLVDDQLSSTDTLLVAGSWKAIHRLQGLSRDFLVLGVPAEIDEIAPAASKAPYALLSLALMVGLMLSSAVPNVLAALVACMLLGAFKCIDLDSAYRSIHWPTLILIVGMLPFAQALQQTGGVDLAVQALVSALGKAGPHVLLAALFVATAVIGLFISNTATAVLMAPIAIATAQSLELSAYPFALAVALAASAAFMTPVSSPVNTLVLGPGQYRFGDFVKVGVPLTVLVMLICVLLIPLIFPF